ncbi:beta-lactamase family protein, partial [Candidatus Dependentiae bacterium]|nr:beta-lactamase family protein [Candidatus Dependentiae bacterium]
MTKSSIIKFQDPETTSRGLVEKGSSELDQLVIIPVGDSIGIDGFPISSSISTMTFGGGEEKFTSANVTSDTIFCAGSVTKMITAVTMLRMTEEDQYKEHFPDGAETKLSTILPTLKKHFPHSKYITEDLETQPNFEEITLRDLAQHTSGLSNFSGKDLIGEVYDSVNQRIQKDMLDTAKSPCTGQHGERVGEHSYNNLGYELLGRVIVAVARETEPTKEFGDVVNELVIDRVKEKVGPEKSATVKFFTADQMEIGPDGKTKVKAHPGLTVEFGKHYHDKKFLQVVPSCIYHDMTAGGGYTTPESMSCIAFHVLTDKAEFSIFKKPETLAVFNSSQVKLSDGSTYGFGYRSTLANPKLRGHGGLDFGSNSGVVVDIEANKVATTMLAFENLTLPIAYALKHKAKSTEPIELDSELHAKTLELSKNYSEAQLLEMRNDLEKSYEDFAEKFGVISKQRSEALDLAPHSILINCAKKLGYSFDDRGMCFGIAMRWIEASLTDAEEIFMDRMDKIKSINSALDRGMTISAINKEDLSDVKAFFESASLYQQPRLHHGLLSKSIEQQD